MRRDHSRASTSASLSAFDVNRRALLKRGAALGLSAAAVGPLAALISACRPAAAPTPSPILTPGPITPSPFLTPSPIAEHVLEVWNWFTGTGGPDEELYTQTLGPAYEGANPHIAIDWVAQPIGELLTLYTTACRAGNEGALNFMLPGDAWATVHDCMEVLQEDDLADLRPVLSGWPHTTSVDGSVWGIPLQLHSTVWYYNKALFAEAGLDPEAPPSDWAELTTACEALMAAGILPMSIGLAGGNLGRILLQGFMTQYHTSEELQGLRTAEISAGERMEPALRYTAEMANNGWWGDRYEAKTWFQEAIDEFADGQSAMIVGLITSRSASWFWFDEALGKDAYGVFNTPALPDAPYPDAMEIHAASAISISKNAPFGPALDLAKFLVSRETQAEGLRAIGFIPNRMDVDLGLADSPVAADIAQLLATKRLTDWWFPPPQTGDYIIASLGEALRSPAAQQTFLAEVSRLQQLEAP